MKTRCIFSTPSICNNLWLFNFLFVAGTLPATGILFLRAA